MLKQSITLSHTKKFRLKLIGLTLSFCFVYFVFICLIHQLPIGVRWNVSQSLSYKLFLSAPFKKPYRDRYVSFRHPQSPIPLAKMIVGLPGDLITQRDQSIYVNDREIGMLQGYFSSGAPLIPIAEGTIPEEHVFVCAPHSESFDSRYQEFGLIHFDQLEETLWPIF